MIDHDDMAVKISRCIELHLMTSTRFVFVFFH